MPIDREFFYTTGPLIGMIHCSCCSQPANHAINGIPYCDTHLPTNRPDVRLDFLPISKWILHMESRIEALEASHRELLEAASHIDVLGGCAGNAYTRLKIAISQARQLEAKSRG